MRINQILKEVRNKNLKIKNFLLLLKFSNFFLNYKNTKNKSKKYSDIFYNTWKNEIEKDQLKKKLETEVPQ